MSRKILCPNCASLLNEDVLKQKKSENTCLVCGTSLDGDDTEKPVKSESEELVTWYYYSMSRGYYLSDVPLNNKNLYHLKYKFHAPNDTDKAKEVLRQEYDPSAFINLSVNNKSESIVKCPHCGSSNIQIIQKKWSIWTGFRTNAVERVCVNCKHRF